MERQKISSCVGRDRLLLRIDMKIDIQNTQKDSGFTLIEIIVSLAIFTIVAVVAVGAFLKVIDANKKSQSLKTATNNINFALESMTREMRVGSVYTCYTSISNPSTIPGTLSGYGTSCPTGNGKGVAFYSSKTSSSGGVPCNLIHAYVFDDTPSGSGIYTLYKASQTSCGTTLDYPADFTAVISPDAIIDAFDFRVITAADSSGPQPKASLRIKGHTGIKERNKTFFDVQTTISQRNSF